MQNILYSFLLLLLGMAPLAAQTFTRITSGDLVTSGSSPRGSAWGDYNNDGFSDIFLTDSNATNLLFRNNGDGTFTRMSAAEVGELVNDSGNSNSATWGDVDNDGDLDLYVPTRNQNNFFYRNNGDGTFSKITSGTIVEQSGFSDAAAWGDYDNDGHLDLFVANKDDNNFLFHNNGNATFTRITSGAIVNDGGKSSAGIWGDYDNDGFLDLFVANDRDDGGSENNFLYRNNGDGTFSKITSGEVVTDGGDSESACWGDYDNDGYLDLFVANDGPDGDQDNFLYHNNRNGTFSRVNGGKIVRDGGDSEDCSWGDYDNDGFLDLFVANNQGQNNFLYQNKGNGTFTKIEVGSLVSDGGASESCSWADYDNDGDLDLFVANEQESNFLYRNEGTSNSWLVVRLTGTVSNAAAIGAVVRVRASLDGGGPEWQMRQISGLSNTKGQNSLEAEFGLGFAGTVDSLIVEWPGQSQTRLGNLNINQIVDIIEDASGVPPSPPQNLTATAVSATQIDLTWEPGNNEPRRYYLFRSLSPGTGYTLIDSVDAPQTVYSDTVLTPGTTYYYRARAANQWGESGLTAPVSATTPGVPPTAPQNLTAAAVSAGQIDLNWLPADNQPAKYYLYRSLTAGTGFSLIDSVAHPATAFSDINVEPLTTYFYQVRAGNVWGLSPPSNQAEASTPGLPPTIPQNLTAEAVSAGQIDLAWQPSENGPQKYYLQRSLTSGAGFVRIDSVDHPTLSYSDTAITSNTTYYYRVSAGNAWGESLPSAEDSVTTPPVGAPSAPANLTAEAVSRSQVELSWLPSENDPLRYYLLRSRTSGSGFVRIDSVDHPLTTFSDSGLDSSTTYYYRVRAVNVLGTSPPSTEAGATTWGAPLPVSDLTATVLSPSRIELRWLPGDGKPLRYRIYRSLSSGGGFALTDSLAAPAFHYRDSLLTPATTYYYRVTAVNGFGESRPSNEDSAATLGIPPGVPQNLTAAAVAARQIDLSWLPATNGPQQYYLYRSLTLNSGYALIDSAAHPLTAFSDATVEPLTTYFYQVRAGNSWGVSPPSDPANATTFGLPPTAPANLNAAAVSASQIDLEWDPSDNEPSQYLIYRSPSSGTGFTIIDSTVHPATRYADTLVVANTTYFYRVTARNAWGESPPSGQDSASTPPAGAPSAPANLAAEAVSRSQIELSWLPSETDPLRYYLLRSRTSGSGFVRIDSVDHPLTNFSDSGLDSSTTYYYRVRAANSLGFSPFSNDARATTWGAPPPVTGLEASAVSASQIELRWQASDGNPLRYFIYRSQTAGEGFALINSVVAPATQYRDSLLAPSSTYYYRITVLNAFGESQPSAEESATTWGLPPGVPEGLSAAAVSSSQIDLTWLPSDNDPQRYYIYRSLTSVGGFKIVDSLDAPGVSYSDTGLSPATTYHYRVQAMNSWGTSGQSPIANATTEGLPPLAPDTLTATANSITQIELAWALSVNQPRRYYIYRSQNSGSGFVRIDSVIHPTNNYRDSGLLPATTYFYQISAANEWGESPRSPEARATTLAGELQPPAIDGATLTITPALPREGEPVELSVQVSGTQLAVSVLLNSQNSLFAGKQIAMAGEGDRYRVQIPDSLVTAEGLWFRIVAVNTLATVSYPPQPDIIELPVQIENFAALQQNSGYPDGIPPNGWNTVALPFAADQPLSLTGLFGAQEFNRNGEPLNWSAYEYRDSDFQPVTEIRNGRGYFLYHKSAGARQLTVAAATSNPLLILDDLLLAPGWNLIPWPHAFSAGVLINDPERIGSVWQQRRGNWERLTARLTPQQPETSARPFAALAVFNETSQDIPLKEALWLTNRRDLLKQPHSPETPPLDWSMQLQLRAGDRADLYNTLGISTAAQTGREGLNEAEPPQIGRYLQLYFPLEIAGETQKLSSDIRSGAAPGHRWEVRLENTTPEKEVTLSWEMPPLPAGWAATLIDISLQQLLPLSGPEAISQYRFASRSRQRFVVIAGRKEYVNRSVQQIQAELPREYRLSQNYPNPFNAATTLLVELPRASKVRLTVFNSLGQKVKLLLKGEYDTGRHAVSWDGSDISNRPVASGLYFFRLEAGTYLKTIKGILVK